MTNRSPRNRTRRRTKSADYEVGKGKPPTHSRFKTGQSGNPRGRPRKPKPGERSLEDFANEIVTVTRNGREIKMTKREIAALHLVDSAAKGDFRSGIELERRLGEARMSDEGEAGDIFDQEAARKLLDRFADEVRKETLESREDGDDAE